MTKQDSIHQAPAPFAWGAIQLTQCVFVDAVPHVTRAAMGEWLEYADPQNGIDIILRRNPHIEAYSVPVNLTGTDGKKYDTKVYHPIGFLLTVMESGQPKAQSMKVAVAEFVWHFAGPRELNFKEELELMKLQRNLFNDLAKSKDAFVVAGLRERLSRVCLSLGQALPDIATLGKDATQLRADQLTLPGLPDERGAFGDQRGENP